MGRRGRGGQRRAAKVEARRRRRAAATRPPRRARHERAGTAPATASPDRRGDAPAGDRADFATLLGDIVAGLDELDDELDDDFEDAFDDLDDDDGEPDRFDELVEQVRVAVAETVERRDAEVARVLVDAAHRSADRLFADDPRHPYSGDRVLVDLIVDSWLGKARRRRPDDDLRHRAVVWVAEELGETGPAVEDAARILRPTTPRAWMADFLRTPDDVLVARIWLLAGVVALGLGRGAVPIDVLGAGDGR